MSTAFWIRRTLLVFSLTFIGITVAQLLKGHDLSYASSEALLWGGIATGVFTLIRLYQFRRGKHCALCPDTPETQRK